MLKNCTIIGRQDNMMGLSELRSETDFRKKATEDKKNVYVNVTTRIIHCKRCKCTQNVKSELIVEIFKEVKVFRLKHTGCTP